MGRDIVLGREREVTRSPLESSRLSQVVDSLGNFFQMTFIPILAFARFHRSPRTANNFWNSNNDLAAKGIARQR